MKPVVARAAAPPSASVVLRRPSTAAPRDATTSAGPVSGFPGADDALAAHVAPAIAGQAAANVLPAQSLAAGAGPLEARRPVDIGHASSDWIVERPRSWAARLLALYAAGFLLMGWRVWSVMAQSAALRLDPTRISLRVKHADTLRLLGRREEGLAALDAAEAALRTLEAGGRELGARRTLGKTAIAQRWARLARGFTAFSKRYRAEVAQARAIELAPQRPGLWTGYARLLGHRGHDSAMIEANRRALELAPDDAGVAEALANAYRQTDQDAMAAETSRRFVATSAIARERSAKAEPPLAHAPRPLDTAPTIVIDLTDLLNFLSRNLFVSGIQRVQAELALALLRRRNRNIVPAIYDARHGRWRLANVDAVVALIKHARRRRLFGRWRLKRLIDAAMQANTGDFRRLRQPVLFNPGATWADWRYLLSVREAKRRQGLRFVPFAHDCIPLILPETCSRDIPMAYSRWLAGVAELADAFVVNSKRTEEDLSAMLAMATDRSPPIGAAPLDGGTALARRPLRPRLGRATMQAMARRSFVLCVGSIEPRKNHLLLFNAWRRLLDAHGARAPMLVVVGRAGWREDDALGFVDADPELRSSILILPDVSDAELAWFYAKARFSVCASVYEGWGMPITESFNAGLPVLAARNSALIEAGGDAATFFRTGDLDDLHEKLETLSFDDRALREARRRALDAPLRPWRQVALDAMRVINRAGRDPFDPRRLAPRLDRDRRYDFGRRAFGPEMVVQEAAMHGQAWTGRDVGGLWTATGEAARLCFRSGDAAAAQAIALEFSAPSRPTIVSLTVEISVDREAARVSDRIALDADGARTAVLALADAEAALSAAGVDASSERYYEIFIETLDADQPADAPMDAPEIGLRGVGVRSARLISALN